ncbi:type II toxin-antitoxin system VapC family toxin [bacterium CPR1]|nr:type II toxin-antitoxin system VapC family toxin [bacterium CPR1]
MYGEVSAALRKVGRPKPALDLFVAATAKHHGLIVATLNAKDFQGVPGVAVEDWSP